MESSRETVFVEKAVSFLKNLFKEKGYPEDSFDENHIISFSYNNLNFTIEIPLIIKKDSKTYFIVDYKPMERLSIFERGILALARLFFDPLPYFGLVTNLKDFVLIDLYEFSVIKGKKEIIPEYKALVSHSPKKLKEFKPELEEKILAVYLSGG